MIVDYYAILGVERHVTQEEIKKAYRERLKEWHPDNQPAEKEKEAKNQTQLINEAYEMLANPKTRKKYDEELSKNKPKDADGKDEPIDYFQIRKDMDKIYKDFADVLARITRYKGSDFYPGDELIKKRTNLTLQIIQWIEQIKSYKNFKDCNKILEMLFTKIETYNKHLPYRISKSVDSEIDALYTLYKNEFRTFINSSSDKTIICNFLIRKYVELMPDNNRRFYS